MNTTPVLLVSVSLIRLKSDGGRLIDIGMPASDVTVDDVVSLSPAVD